ncbi:hypothetical protein CSKR_203247 [Clonorchis sinensis]|uniref:Uncharacterized protein n=1 Tax=Clonorchis sinensis TaxID=79923 RepID=A0A8T1M8U3_CLOSI|nr:hypothetical protein CSKR_203247 [Clonorchis sinensis]
MNKTCPPYCQSLSDSSPSFLMSELSFSVTPLSSIISSLFVPFCPVHLIHFINSPNITSHFCRYAFFNVVFFSPRNRKPFVDQLFHTQTNTHIDNVYLRSIRFILFPVSLSID